MTGLAARRVEVRLGGRTILGGVDLEVDRGGWLALIGPNGAGKTTLLRALAGLVSYTGSIEVGGRALADLGRTEIARRIALVPQEPAVPPWMTVSEYVLLGRTPHLRALAAETAHDRQVAAETLARLDLLAFRARRLGTLSGGERQRVVVARALAQEAPVVLLDEPTASLDIGHQQQAFELLDELRVESGLTLVTAMHDLTLAAQYADSLVLLDEGRVAVQGEPGAVLTEAIVSGHYGANVDVVSLDGRLVVLPRREARDRAVSPL